MAPVTPPRPTSVAIAGDVPVEVAWSVDPDSQRALVYLHGHCGDPTAFRGWADAATSHGTLMSLRGDLECPRRPGRRKWSFDLARIDRRIRAALQAVSDHRGRSDGGLRAEDIALIGYSQGALRVEFLAHAFPQRYRRVVSIAVAAAPSPYRFREAERVLFMAGGWDVRRHIRDGYDELRHLQRGQGRGETRYLELPRARHGSYGPEGRAVMAEGLDWLFE
ncbi:MAG: hypothetical protein AAGN82_15875 [Myxococcota bacterium]